MTARTNRPFLRAEAGFLSSDDCIEASDAIQKAIYQLMEKPNQIKHWVYFCVVWKKLYVVAVKNVVKNDDIVVL